MSDAVAGERPPQQLSRARRARGTLRIAARMEGGATALAAVALSLVAGAGVLLVAGYDPVSTYRYFLIDNFTSAAALANLFNTATPLLILALSAILTFRVGVFCIGQEGQMYLGALASAVVILAVPGLPGPLLIVLGLGAGVVVGAAWAAIVGLLRARLDVDEIVSSLMLNYVATLLTLYLVRTQFEASGVGLATRLLPSKAWWPVLPGPLAISAGLLVAVVLVGATWLFLFRTPSGTAAQAVASNVRCAEALGVARTRLVVGVVAASGAVAGVAGANLVIGNQHQFVQSFSPGYGFIGIAVALLARLSPLGACAMAVIYAAFLNGATTLQIFTSVPQEFVDVLVGTVVILATARVRAKARRGGELT
jgi:general nucleoside transport system permease protein